MNRVAVVLLFSALGAIPAVAAFSTTIAARQPNPNSATVSVWTSDSGNPQVVAWQQPAGASFSPVGIFAYLCTVNGDPATGTAYLMKKVGPGTTVADQIASAPISTSTPCTSLATAAQVAAAPDTSLNFGNVTLSAPAATTFYLVISDATANLGWVFEENPAPTTACNNGTCPNNGFAILAADMAAPVANAYPPASTFSTALSPNNGALFRVLGNAATPPGTVPALSTWAFAGTILLLLGSGVFLIRRMRLQE